MIAEWLGASKEMGFLVFSNVVIIVVLGMVVRMLWTQAKKDEEARRQELVNTHTDRLKDKNAELAQVWNQLRESRDEIRIIRAEKEWLERMNDRGDEMNVMLIEELRKRPSIRPRS